VSIKECRIADSPGIGGIRGNIEKGVVVFRINKDKMMMAKVESWEKKKNIMLNKSKLKERKGERMYLDNKRRKENTNEVKRGG
jgi:hypothetical protein